MTGAAPGQQQHVQVFRKLLLRRRLLRWAHQGAAYVPFIGDGDIAADLYRERAVYGADLDPERVETAQARLPNAMVLEADCNAWPFMGIGDRFAVADFDSYSDPYPSFRSFWAHARRAARVVMFFTDGHPQGIARTGHWHLPDGSKRYLPNQGALRSAVFNPYFSRFVLPWFEEYVKPWRLIDKFRYRRGMMLYWGAVVERAEGKEAGAVRR